MYNLYDDCWYENDLMRASNSKQLRDFHTNINERSYFGPPPLTGASAEEGLATSRTHRSTSARTRPTPATSPSCPRPASHHPLLRPHNQSMV